ncbi:MAG: ABC transporter ATP-binding protein [Kineosporiaceae bacterium]
MTTTTGAPALQLHEVTKRFGDVLAVDGLELTVTAGEVVAVLGPNGAGKTTTLDMVLGLARPTSGTVRAFGLDPTRAVAAGRVAAVLQSGGLLRDLTVGETVRLTASFLRSHRPVAEVLERAGIADLAPRRVGTCSGGQQQRVRFALALLPDPDLLILDEPTTGMDVAGRRDFWTAMRQDAQRGRTVVFATHYLDEADAYADRIVLVRAGRVVADGTPAQIKNLASGRVVSATWPAPAEGEPGELALLAAPHVRGVERRGDTVLVTTTDSDAVARYLLTATPACDLEITSHHLEDAVLSLLDGAAPPLPLDAETGGSRTDELVRSTR